MWEKIGLGGTLAAAPHEETVTFQVTHVRSAPGEGFAVLFLGG